MRMMIYVILMVDEWSAQGQSDSNLEHKGQAVADTRINRLFRRNRRRCSSVFF